MDLENRTVMKIRLHFEVSYKDVIFFKNMLQKYAVQLYAF